MPDTRLLTTAALLRATGRILAYKATKRPVSHDIVRSAIRSLYAHADTAEKMYNLQSEGGNHHGV